VGPVFDNFLSQQADGFIRAVPEIGKNHKWLQEWTPHLAVPIVFLRTRPSDGLPVVCFENRAGGIGATSPEIHWLALGLVVRISSTST
jgi:hypothetical protein